MKGIKMAYDEIKDELLENAKILMDSQVEETQKIFAFQKIKSLVFFDHQNLLAPPHKFFIIYMSQKIMSDFWRNFATDASFGLEYISDQTCFDDFMSNLGGFIKYSIEEDFAQGYMSLSKTIISYYKMVDYIDENLGIETLLK